MIRNQPPVFSLRRFMACLLILAALCGSVQAGTGTWTTNGPFATGLGNKNISALAVSPDGFIIYSGTGSSSVFSFTLPAPATHFAVSTPTPSPVTAGNTVSCTVTALDSGNNPVTGYTGTVVFSGTDGAAVLPADYTFTGADAGAHTFTATLKTAGISGAVTVSPASAASLVVTAPGLVGTGNPFSVIVKALDAYGNTATGYRGNVHFTSSDSAAILPGSYSFTGADAGIHTFSATLSTLGTRTITTSDTVLTATSGAIIVTLTVPIPTFSSIAPITGTTVGGTPVTITGTGFTGASTVTFDGINAGTIVVASDTRITATTPAHAAGAVNVVVTTGGGAATGTGAFTYVTPIVPTTVPTSTPTFLNSGGTSDSGNNDPSLPGTQQASGTVPVNVGGRTPVSSIVVTGTGNGDIIITATEAPGPGLDIPLPPGIVYQYLDITPARYGVITGAEISFVVPQSWLDEHLLTPGDVVMYHRVGGTWQALPTRLVRSINGQLWFTASSPGLSRFAITGQASGSAGLPAATASSHVPVSDELVKSSGTGPAVSGASGPAASRTLAPQAPSAPDTGFPVTIIVLVGITGVGFIGGWLLVRRWWIRRPNPALFREFD